MYYYKLSEDEKELMEEIMKITSYDYELLGDFMPVDRFISALQDMKIQYDILQEENQRLDLKENYGIEDYPEYS